MARKISSSKPTRPTCRVWNPLGHDPSDRAKATELARDYGTKLYTGVLYRNPNPPSTYGQGVTERQEALKKNAVPRHEILNRFKPTN